MTTATFARKSDGRFDFSEAHVSQLNASLRGRAGQAGPRLPATLMAAVTEELIEATQQVADDLHIPFLEAAARVVKKRPALFKLSRGITIDDEDPSADVSIEKTA